MYAYTRRHQAGERVAMRHWLRKHGIDPVMGDEPEHTQRLMIQVEEAGGNSDELMTLGRARVDARELIHPSQGVSQ